MDFPRRMVPREPKAPIAAAPVIPPGGARELELLWELWELLLL